MTPEERDIIRVNEPKLVQDIMPTDLLCWLLCLTDEDQEVIMAEERNYGSTRAARTLLDRLKRRHNSFGQLVRALRENTLGHLASLLDPNNEGIIIKLVNWFGNEANVNPKHHILKRIFSLPTIFIFCSWWRLKTMEYVQF